MSNQGTNKNDFSLRENLIKTAVQFLQNPQIFSSPTNQKQNFLKGKGLTNEEIKQAFKLAGVDNLEQNMLHTQNEYTTIPIPQNQIYPYYQMNPYEHTYVQKIKEFFNATAFIGMTVYYLYQFYKSFIKPFLFGRKKKDNIQESVSKLDTNIQNSMKEVKESITKVEGDMERLTKNQTIDPVIPQLIQELKQEISSLKALILSRKQFPSAPASIPIWQLGTGNQSQEKSAEREDDAGSGSSVNNSDSSLEMIREDPPKK